MKLAPLAEILTAAEAEQFGLAVVTEDPVEQLRAEMYKARNVFGVGAGLSICIVPTPNTLFIIKTSTELPE